MTIHQLRAEIKAIQGRLNSKEIYTILLILIVGFGSFGLGRLSKLRELQSPILLEQTLSASAVSAGSFASPPPTLEGENTSAISSVKGQSSNVTGSIAPGGQFVASKSGAKYHFPWCSGAQRISEANKIWFTSVEEARKAGYTPASNCKGLK